MVLLLIQLLTPYCSFLILGKVREIKDVPKSLKELLTFTGFISKKVNQFESVLK